MLQQVIKEDLLHYVWKTKLINVKELKTVDGKPLLIQDFGIHNHDSGPDFFNGRIILDNLLWIGNIEMHVFSSDWDNHSHDSDPAYNNVVLHVVYEHDKKAYTSEGIEIPCIELKSRINDTIKLNYTRLIQTTNQIPCKEYLKRIDTLTLLFLKDRMIIERLEAKTAYLSQLLKQSKKDWEYAFYIMLARYMGGKVNNDAFELLAKNISMQLLLKKIDNSLSVEALLFGAAGMLKAGYKDPYFLELKREFAHLQTLYKLDTVPPVMWKFSRMRPANFPTIRIAQLSAIVLKNKRLFSKIIHCEKMTDVYPLFQVTASKYWDNHYLFDKSSTPRIKKLTKSYIDLLVINVIAPTLFLYGKEKDEPSYCEKAISFLSNIKGEKNKITTKWNDLGISTSTAMDSQALIHLKHNYCAKKKCLNCTIGNNLIQTIGNHNQ